MSSIEIVANGLVLGFCMAYRNELVASINALWSKLVSLFKKAGN